MDVVPDRGKFNRKLSLVNHAKKNQTKLTHNFVLTTSKSSSSEVFFKKVSLKISQNSLKNTHVEVSFLIALQASGLQLRKYLARPEAYLGR